MASALDIALGLAARGFPVFPCSAKKRPAIGKKLGGNGFHDATCNPEAVQALWRQVAAPLVGVPTGAIAAFDVLDIDYRSGGTDWEAANTARLPETRIHQTMSGGRHYVFRHAPGVRNSASKVTLAPGIDVRGDGGYVIFPPSPGYSIINDAEPAEWPDWLLELVLARPMGSPKVIAPDPVAITSKRLDGLQKSILARVSSAPDGQKHVALRNAALSMGGIAASAGMTTDQAVRLLMSALPPTVQDWANAEKTAVWGIERGMAAPLELPDREPYHPRYTNGAPNGHHHPDYHDDPPQPLVSGANVIKFEPRAAADWREEWHRSESGTPIPNLYNAMVTLRRHPQLSILLKFDEMERAAVLMGQVPGTPHDPTVPRALNDTDTLAIQEEIQQAGLRRIAKATVQDATDLRAQQSRFHPVRDYLATLIWDGKPRIDDWLTYYLGAEPPVELAKEEREAKLSYLKTIGRLFLIALIARVMEPGCKADYMMILEGPQGARKSTACRILSCGWFSDSLPDLARGDPVRRSMHLRGKWLIEIAELSSFSAAEAHTLKEFITQTHEQYVSKYGRKEVKEARQCLFIGSTNETVYLRDSTGGRRFWPVKCGEINIDDLAADRDQLLAEALVAYRAGEPWYPEREFEATFIAPEQAARYEEDAWQSDIENWLRREGVRSATATEILRGALSFPPHLINRPAQLRVTTILKLLKWERNEKANRKPYVAPDGW